MADIIGRILTKGRDMLGGWEKLRFAHALASLAWTIGEGRCQSIALLVRAIHEKIYPDKLHGAALFALRRTLGQERWLPEMIVKINGEQPLGDRR